MAYYLQNLMTDALLEIKDEIKEENESSLEFKFEIKELASYRVAPSGLCKLARKFFTNPSPSEIITCKPAKPLTYKINCSDKGVLTEALLRLAELIDKKHEHLIKKYPDRRQIPFYKLAGLNGSDYKTFDFVRILSKVEAKIEKYDCQITIGKFPILYQFNPTPEKIKNNTPKTLPKFAKDFLFTPEHYNLEYRKKLRNKEGRNSETYTSSNRENERDVYFVEIYYDPEKTDTLKNNSYYIPKSILNQGGGFNMISRADPTDESEFLLLLPDMDEEELEIFDTLEIDDSEKIILKGGITETIESLINMHEECFTSNNKKYPITNDPIKSKTYTIQNNFKIEDDKSTASTWKDHIKKANDYVKESGFVFSEKTRISQYSINEHLVYYARNPLHSPNLSESKEDERLKPFPYSTPERVRGMLRRIDGALDSRKKRKALGELNKAIPLRFMARKRDGKNLGDVINRELGAHRRSGSAYPATTATTEAFRHNHLIYAKYINYCNPELSDIKILPLRTKQEWCHLIAYKDSGGNKANNLVAGSFHANTEQCAIEGAIRSFEHYGQVTVKLTAYLHPSPVLYNSAEIGKIDTPNEFKDTESLSEFISLFAKKNPKTASSKWPDTQTLYEIILNGRHIENNITLKKLANLIIKENATPSSPKRGEKSTTTASQILAFYRKPINPNSDFEESESDKKTDKMLRATFEDLRTKYYHDIPVAAFVRYVIFVNNTKALNYVVDSQREEFNRHEFKLTYLTVLTGLENCLHTDESEQEPIEETSKLQEKYKKKQAIKTNKIITSTASRQTNRSTTERRSQRNRTIKDDRIKKHEPEKTKKFRK